MPDMRLVIAGAGGRMGRTLVKAIAGMDGVAVVGALEGAGSPLHRSGCGRARGASGLRHQGDGRSEAAARSR